MEADQSLDDFVPPRFGPHEGWVVPQVLHEPLLEARHLEEEGRFLHLLERVA